MISENNINKKGFTLSEMMVVIFIFSIIIASALPTITKRQKPSVNEVIPSGVIILWYGNVASSGFPSGWSPLNGSVSGVPNLTNRFIVGAGGTYAVTSTGGGNTYSLPSTSYMPAHNHTYTVSGPSPSSHTHTVSSVSTSGNHRHAYNTTAESDHTHTISADWLTTSGTSVSGCNFSIGSLSIYRLTSPSISDPNTDHAHTDSASSNEGNHSHSYSSTSSNSNSHTHTMYLGSNGSGSAFSTLPPYRALYFLIKD